MFYSLVLVAVTLIAPTQGQQGSDMDDEDFAAYMNFHEDMRQVAAEYSSTAGRGCVKGGVTGALAGKGFHGLCIGCAIGAAGELASEMTFPRDPQDRSNK